MNKKIKKMFETTKQSPLSDELYFAIEKMKYNNGMPTGHESTQWIHLQDAVSQGSITPWEAYQCIKLGYVAEHLKTRKSRYSHLL